MASKLASMIEKSGHTQESAAHAIGVSVRTVSNWCSMAFPPRITSYQAIASALDATIPQVQHAVRQIETAILNRGKTRTHQHPRARRAISA